VHSKLIDLLADQLQLPREISPKVANYITDHYGVDVDAIGAFLTSELPKLEDYEIDLILSPLFTPKFADQIVFAGLLGAESVHREEWTALVQRLETRRVTARLMTADGKTHEVRLREVMIERYVHRLRLEGGIAESVANLIGRTPEADRPMLQAIARRGVWESEGSSGILERYLETTIRDGSYALGDVLDLLHLAEDRKPADAADLLARIPQWREALRDQIEKAGGSRVFFHDDIRWMHGGDRDHRQVDGSRVSAKERELAFLSRLEQVFSE
jgi:hypothetical protein